MSWLFASIGLAVKDPQAARFAGFAPVLPLVYLSGAWVPVDSMDGAVQAFARNQPVNVLVETVRRLSDGAPAAQWVWLSIAWSVGHRGALRQHRRPAVPAGLEHHTVRS